jgi:hypothetical protein
MCVVIHPKPTYNLFITHVQLDGALAGMSHITLLEHSIDLISPCSIT